MRSIALRLMGFVLASAFASGADFRMLNPTHSSRTRAGLLWELSLSFDAGKDVGQSLGSLFELRDKQKRVIGGAGFHDIHGTYFRGNNRKINFFVKNNKVLPQIESRGNPFTDKQNGAHLITSWNDLIAIDKAFSWLPKVKLASDYSWIPAGVLDRPQVSGFQYIDNRLMTFFSSSVEYDGKTIFASPEAASRFSFYYVDGILFAYRTSDAWSLYACRWTYTDALPINLNECENFPMPDGLIPITFGNLNGSVLMGLNNGTIYQYQDGILKIVFEKSNPKESWQPYSMTNYYGSIVMGQYPTGSVFVFDGTDLSEFPLPVPLPVGVTNAHREAQTLQLYHGDLHVGVWPWGEVWRFDCFDKKWKFVGRMFSHPELSGEQAPYFKQMSAIQGVPDYWGQRIESFSTLGDKLYIATRNKTGDPYLPVHQSFLSPEKVSEYGRVSALTADTSMTAQFEWRTSPVQFHFSIYSDRIEIRENSFLIAEREGDYSDFPRRIRTIELGSGVFGDAKADIMAARECQVTGGRRQCRKLHSFQPVTKWVK